MLSRGRMAHHPAGAITVSFLTIPTELVRISCPNHERKLPALMAQDTACSTLVLDRSDGEPLSPGSTSADTIGANRAVHAPLDRPTVIDLRRARPRVSPDLLRIGIAGLAVVFSYEGYRWLGVLHPGDQRLSALVFGRPGTALVAILALAASFAVPIPVGWGRSLAERILLASALAVFAATCIEAVGVGPAPGATLGATDLAFAAAAFAFFLISECRELQSETVHSDGLPSIE